MSFIETQPLLAALIALLGLGVTFGAILGFGLDSLSHRGQSAR